MNNYLQCSLKRGNVLKTSWIPEKFAVKGKHLKLKDEDGWQVMAVGNFRQTKKECIERERDFTKQRKASDI